MSAAPALKVGSPAEYNTLIPVRLATELRGISRVAKCCCHRTDPITNSPSKVRKDKRMEFFFAELGALTIWMMVAGTAGLIGSNRGESGFKWFFYAVFLGPLALLAAFTAGKKCSRCDIRISRKAMVCVHCQADQ